jgi:demethylmenaquinone methyltransferase/2-methoxy-6-polyprenyl-1,4-benzoquinol methylase
MNMEIKPYSEEEAKKGQVSRMFNRIAPYYDFLNHLLSLGIDRYWRKKAISMLGHGKYPKILDMATGTADVALTLKKYYPDSNITGLDISVEMLAIGREKINRKGLTPSITLLEGDSENIPFPDHYFDAITVAFGVRNFENLDKGISEMQRVLKKEGKLIVLEFSQPTFFLFKFIFNFYFKYILPFIGRLTSKDPRAYKYLYESVQAFPSGNKFLDVLGKNGFKPVQCTPLTVGICSVYLAEK